MNVSKLNYIFTPRNESDSGVYGNVRECIILFENGTQKVITNNNMKGHLTVKVLTHLAGENDFVEAVMKHYKSVRTLDELAEKCGYKCTKTFTRHFKTNFNTTPKQWLLEIKKNELMSCLKNTNYPLKHISEELGFSNVSHLSDFCLKKTGMRPDEIRNKR